MQLCEYKGKYIDMQIDEKLLELKDFAKNNGVPIVRDITATRLEAEVTVRKPKRILEIGTAIGYSALIMLQCARDAEIVTIEKDTDRYNMACDTLKDFNSVKAINGDAYEVLDRLIADGEKFDFVFLDGPKGFYYRYLVKIEQLLNNNACIFADNIGFFGMVKSNKYPHRHKTIVVSLQNYLARVSQPPFSSVIEYDIDDGFAISDYKENI